MDASRSDWSSPYQNYAATEFLRLWVGTWSLPATQGRRERESIRSGYLQSKLWQENRQPAIVRANGRCEHCRRAPVDEVHHKSYKHLFYELPEELEAVCHPCHEFKHGHRKDDPKDWRQAEQERFWREGEAM